MAWLTIMGMTVAVIVALGYPIVGPKRQRQSGRKDAGDRLDQRKLSIYRDIKDLEFDLETGKVSEEDYQSMRTEYENRAVTVLEALDRQDSRHRKQPGPNSTPLFCPACGQLIKERDRFCGTCGEAVSLAV